MCRSKCTRKVEDAISTSAGSGCAQAASPSMRMAPGEGAVAAALVIDKQTLERLVRLEKSRQGHT